MSKTVETREFRMLPCPLSVSEWASIGYELARLIKELDEAQELEMTRRRAYDELIDGGHARIREYVRLLTNGAVERQTECALTWDVETREVTVVRLDTGNIIQRREMTDDEFPLGTETPELSPPTVQ